MEPFDLVVVGGGAAGFMTAITAAENGVKRIIILEGTSKLMEKVRISGGGRCNVTNATWIPNELVENYPRGGIQLLESFLLLELLHLGHMRALFGAHKLKNINQ